MKLNDAVLGAVFFALSLLVFWSIRGYPSIPGQNVGPAAFPGVVAAGLAICSVLLMVQGVRSRGGAPWITFDDWTRNPRALLGFAVTVGVLLLYILAADRVGFIVVGIVMLTAMLAALRVRLLLALAVACAATFVIHFAFYKGLRVPLPWGLLPVLY
ncbi:MAG TPA: tripartite tricarboxylate transporter TctB family protein [Burkholderiaceae bacterium]|nr:tripartite tricarboxylate transporter TctB family protein [Burkholderiaceae bacterium]